MKSPTIWRRAGVGMLVCLLALAVLTGCTPKPEPAKPVENPTPQLSGSITIAGSTSVQPVSELLAEAFMELHKQTRISVQGGGSSAGVKAAAEGAAEIGASSRDLKPSEKLLTQFIIGVDGIVVVVHPSSKITDLSLDQIRDLMSGKITNWKEVDGPDVAVVAVTREEGSGTRGAFEEIVMGGDKISSQAIVQSSTGAVRTTVAGDPNAIGYISLAALTADVKAVTVGGVEGTMANIKAGTYKVARPFIYLTKNAPTSVALEFINYVFSPEGQAIVEKAGLIKVR